jgi:hypothetical protein
VVAVQTLSHPIDKKNKNKYVFPCSFFRKTKTYQFMKYIECKKFRDESTKSSCNEIFYMDREVLRTFQIKIFTFVFITEYS